MTENNNINENIINISKKSLYYYKNIKNIDLDEYLNTCMKNSKKVRLKRRFIMANLFNRFSFIYNSKNKLNYLNSNKNISSKLSIKTFKTKQKNSNNTIKNKVKNNNTNINVNVNSTIIGKSKL